MEVHHHSHPVTAGHKKKWTHYFWEFLMLFLAVFCGFLAENIREHNVEQVRAKEFARSLVQDLNNDTTAIGEYRQTSRRYMSFCDTLLKLNKERLEGPVSAKFSFYTRFMYWTQGVSWNRTTFEQIKNSGSLRYFKHGLLEKLMKYDALLNDIESEFFNHETRGNVLLNSINRILDPQVHQDASRLYLMSLDTMSASTLDHYLSIQAPSLENKRNEINEMLNMIVVQQRNLRLGLGQLTMAANLANELITVFSDTYHLK
jgi:hypothetical protein